MLKKNQIIILAIALMTTIAVTVGTITLLSSFDEKSNPNSDTFSNKSEETDEGIVFEDEFKEVIDEQKNNIAKSIEAEASSLMESNPEGAKERFREAEQAYYNAGNLSKMSEMNANVMTAEILIQQQSEQQN